MSLSSGGWVYDSDDESIGYKELGTSGKGSINSETGSVERHFLIHWSALNRFLDDVLGWSYIYPDPPGSGPYTIRRTLPDEHVQFPLFYAAEASFEGAGKPLKASSFIDWDKVKVNVIYRPLDYAVKADGAITNEWERFCSFTAQIQAEAMTIQQAMKFVNSKKAFTGGVSKTSFSEILTVTWHDVPAWKDDPFKIPNETAIALTAGKLNNATWTLGPRRVYPAGTLLFLGAEPKMRTPKLGGNYYSWDIALQFGYRSQGNSRSGSPIGHNYLYDYSISYYDLVTTNGEPTGTPIYESADLTTLFTLG